MSIKYFEIRTAHGTFFRASQKDGLLYHVKKDSSEWHETFSVQGIVSDAWPEWLFLVADTASSPVLSMQHLWVRGKTIPLRLTKGEAEGTVGLGDSLRTGRYVISPALGNKDAHKLVGDCPHVKGWESYHLLEVSPSDEMAKRGQEIVRRFNPSPSMDHIKFVIERAQGAELEYALDALLPFLTSQQIETFSQILLIDRAYREKIQKLIPDNIFLNRALPLFLEWKKNKAEKTPLKRSVHLVSADDESFLAQGEMNVFAGFFHAVNFALRKRQHPQKKACLVTTVRNEGIYILEWIAYHRALGIEHFFIYSNGNDDSSESLLKALDQEGIITYCENKVPEGVSTQIKVYGHALNILPEILDYEWAFIVDIDEFLTLDPKKFSNIEDYFKSFSRFEADAIAVNWQFVGAALNENGLSDLETPVILRNLKYVGAGAVGAGQKLVKSACRPSRTIQSRAHYPLGPCVDSFTYRLTNGELHEFRHPPAGIGRDPGFADNTYGNDLFISHFYYKSMIEWTWKYARNSGLSSTAKLGTARHTQNWANTFILHLSHRHAGTTDWIIAHKDTMLSDLEMLREMPKIKKAEIEVRKTFERKLKELYATIHQENVQERFKPESRFILDDLPIEISGSMLPLNERQGMYEDAISFLEERNIRLDEPISLEGEGKEFLCSKDGLPVFISEKPDGFVLFEKSGKVFDFELQTFDRALPRHTKQETLRQLIVKIKSNYYEYKAKTGKNLFQWIKL